MNSIIYDQEACDIFGSDPNEIAQLYENKLFSQVDLESEKECIHKNICKWLDGRGYCTDCGENFSNVEDLSSTPNNCKHISIHKDELGVMVCTDCGREISTLDYTQEWRNCSSNDGGNIKDLSRCNKLTNQVKGTKSVFEKHKISISASLCSVVETKYNVVLIKVGSKLARGHGRDAIVAACLFYAYQHIGEYRTTDYVRGLFNLSKKQISEGLSAYYTAFPEDRTNHTTREKLIPWIMKLTGVGQSHYRRILAIATYLNNKSSLIQRSNPQSATAGIIFFYLCITPELKNELGLNKSTFAEKAMLSDITITKIVKEIAFVCKVGKNFVI